ITRGRPRQLPRIRARVPPNTARYPGSSPQFSRWLSNHLSARRPMQMPLKKVKCSDSVDSMRSVENFQGGAISNAESVVQPTHFGEFVGDPFIGRDAIVV